MSDPSDPASEGPQIIGATSEELPSSTREVSHVIAFDVRDGERPTGTGEINARWVWTVVTGKRAQELDARQAAWFIKALQWLRDNPPESRKPHSGKDG